MEENKQRMTTQRLAWTIFASVIAAALAGISAWYLIWGRYQVSTDDAQIDAHVASIGSRVSGYVLKVYFDNNQHVKEGEILAMIDPTDYEVAVAQAKADLAAASASARRADLDRRRYTTLFNKNQVSKEVYDRRVSDAEVALAQEELARKKLDEAKLRLSYTRIAAPTAGTVDKRAVEVGNYLQVGSPVMAIVPDSVWVTANFKETQLEHMQPGQKAKVYVDTYPRHVFRGHVDSIQRGTGAAFSLMPPENATGNFVKVVQRVPVKIVLDSADGYWLAPGMSAEPVVYLR